MGIHLTRLLSNFGAIIFVTSRTFHEDYGNVHFIKGNAKDPQFIDLVLKSREWDCIVDFMVYGTSEFRARIDMLMSSTKQYIFLSSARVYSASDNRLTEQSLRILDVTEDKKYLNTDEYALYKAREEDIVINSRYTNYTIIRPYITYAENRLPLGIWEKETWVRRLSEQKSLALPACFLSKQTTLAYGMDVSLYISKIVCNEKALGQIYNIVANKSMTWYEVLNCYLDEIECFKGYRPQIVVVDYFTTNFKQILKNFSLWLFCFRFIRNKINVQDCSYQLIYDREYDRIFDNRKLVELIPEFEFSDTRKKLKSCLRSFMQAPNYSYRNWNWEFVQDKITGNKSTLHDIPGIMLKLRYLLIRYIIPIKCMAKF